MKFDELLTQAVELLQREGRVSYRALKRPLPLMTNTKDLQEGNALLTELNLLVS